MFEVRKVDERIKQHIVDLLRVDVIRHVFAFYDVQHDPEHTTMYAAFENGKLKGYVLIYTALEFPSVILECEDTLVAEKLIQYAPENHFIVHAPPELLPSIKNRFPRAKHYVEKWMLVKKDEAKFFKSKLVRRLSTEEDAIKLFKLLSTQDRPPRSIERCVKWISKMPLYGVSIDNELVAYAGSFLQLPQVWMIGGVYTHPNHRNKGYATLATSAITEEALKSADAAALFVRADNTTAIRVYEKIGYRNIGEKLWVDVGMGLKP
ncbi:MAG: GNAT family N-acetyltransferase [Candidatus Bathyarchaeia archaeon]